VVYQDLSLVPSMTVAANLFLGREPRNRLGLVNRRAVTRGAAAFLDEFGFDLDPSAIVGDLPFAYRQMTEIAKALLGDVGALILDEPTSALTAGEEDVLFDAVRRVTSRGVGVIYVTHRLDEVFQIADRATVFRDGYNVGTWSTTEIDLDGIVTAIIGPAAAQDDTAVETLEFDPEGSAASAPPPPATDATDIPDRIPVLHMAGVTNAKLDDLDLTVHAGEIVGLVGLMGAGRTEILETIFGLRRARTGTMTVCGTKGAPHHPHQAITRGVAMVPEDRHVQGLLLQDSIERNIALPRLPQLSRAGFMDRRDAKRRAREAIRELDIKAPNGRTMLSALSGGNQQKVVFGKWREPDPKLLLLDEPTVGVDVGGREEIYEVIRAAAATGTAVLVASSDLRELLLIAHRLDLVVDGHIVDSVDRRRIRSEQQLHQWVQSAGQSSPAGTEPPVTAPTPA
jgi:ribose transport system ATP-binding protein